MGWTPGLRQPNKTLLAVRCKILDRYPGNTWRHFIDALTRQIGIAIRALEVQGLGHSAAMRAQYLLIYMLLDRFAGEILIRPRLFVISLTK